jgi:hypothetical protein
MGQALMVAWLVAAAVPLVAVATVVVTLQGIVSEPGPRQGVPPEPCYPMESGSARIPCYR